jgi:hypothetical protein
MSNLILSFFAAGLLAVTPNTTTSEPCLDIYGDSANLELCPNMGGISWCHTSANGDETCGDIEPIDICQGDNCIFCDSTTSCGWSTPTSGCSLNFNGGWEIGCWGDMFGNEPDTAEGINLQKIPGLDLSIDLIESYGGCTKTSHGGTCFIDCVGAQCSCVDGWFSWSCMCRLSSQKGPNIETPAAETWGWGKICKGTDVP